jgi:ribosomal protein L24
MWAGLSPREHGHMARFKKGDRVLITEGDFKGQWGVIVDKDIIGDEITVALGENGREIRTHEAHVENADD